VCEATGTKNSNKVVFGNFLTMNDANQFAAAYWHGLSSRDDARSLTIANGDSRFPFEAKCELLRQKDYCSLRVYEASVHELKNDTISQILSEMNYSRIITSQQKVRDILLQELQAVQTTWEAIPQKQRESDFAVTRDTMMDKIKGKSRRKRRQRFVNTERKRPKTDNIPKRTHKDPWDFTDFVVPSHLKSAVSSFEVVWREGMKTPKDFALLAPDDPIRARMRTLEDRISIPIVLYYAVVSFGLHKDGSDFVFTKGLRQLEKVYKQWTSENEFGGLWEFSIFLQKQHNVDLNNLPSSLNVILVSRGMRWGAV